MPTAELSQRQKYEEAEDGDPGDCTHLHLNRESNTYNPCDLGNSISLSVPRILHL